MKTIEQYLKMLPTPYKEMAFENLKNDIPVTNKKKKVDSFENAIYFSFVWSNSPEGHDFWQAIKEDGMVLIDKNK